MNKNFKIAIDLYIIFVNLKYCGKTIIMVFQNTIATNTNKKCILKDDTNKIRLIKYNYKLKQKTNNISKRILQNFNMF